MNAHQIVDANQALKFMNAGKARFTIVSKKTGKRFTYRANAVDDNKPVFVSVLTGSDNETSYSYLGIIDRRNDSYRQTAKSTIAPDAASNTAFGWTHSHLKAGNMPDAIEFWHEGKCGCCGRALTDPQSIEAGFGPICRQRH